MTSYVRLIVPTKLETAVFKEWFECVKACLPSGLIGQTAIVVDDNVKSTNFYLKKMNNNRFAYVVLLVRDLDLSEIHNLVKNWSQHYPDGDFVIDYSQASEQLAPRANDLEQKKIQTVLDAWAKRDHQRWMSSALAHGWKYGIRMSTAQKTHPWLQPWEQLPLAAKQKNLEGVQDLLKILDDVGYTITQQVVA